MEEHELITVMKNAKHEGIRGNAIHEIDRRLKVFDEMMKQLKSLGHACVMERFLEG